MQLTWGCYKKNWQMSQPSQHKWRTLIYCSNCWHCWLPCFISFPCALYWTPIKWLTFQKIYYTLLYNIVIIDWLVCCLVILQTADPRLFLPYSSPCGKPLIQLGGDDKATHDKQRNIQVQTLENCRLKKLVWPVTSLKQIMFNELFSPSPTHFSGVKVYLWWLVS